MSSEDAFQKIEQAMNDEKEWVQLSSFLTDKYMPEIVTFHDHYHEYKNETNGDKRKEMADKMIVKFLTLEGDCCLPDHANCYRELKRKLKRLGKKEYPLDLFVSVYDKCIFSVQSVWDEYLETIAK